MQDYKRGSHTIWDCKYHLVWVTKYRYPILVGDVGQRARELLREIADGQIEHCQVARPSLDL
jgi:putative transposase